jgi:hypothetical protein
VVPAAVDHARKQSIMQARQFGLERVGEALDDR